MEIYKFDIFASTISSYATGEVYKYYGQYNEVKMLAISMGIPNPNLDGALYSCSLKTPNWRRFQNTSYSFSIATPQLQVDIIKNKIDTQAFWFDDDELKTDNQLLIEALYRIYKTTNDNELLYIVQLDDFRQEIYLAAKT